MFIKTILSLAMISTLLFSSFEGTLIDFNALGDDAELEGDLVKPLRNDRWKVKLNSSADFILNKKLSYAKNVLVGETADDRLFLAKRAQNRVLGIRINFPDSYYNAYAVISPGIEIRAFAATDLLEKKGVLKNVGTIKSIRSYVKGRNFPHTIYLNLKNQHNEKSTYFLGHLRYDGWKELIWNNQTYLENVRDRALAVYPKYLKLNPLVKIDSFTVFRHGGNYAGDFVTYISWIKINYDKAVMDDKKEEIDDEAVWEIKKTLFDTKANQEKKRLDLSTELKELELRKMNQADGEKTQQNNNAGAAGGQ